MALGDVVIVVVFTVAITVIILTISDKKNR